MTCVFAGDLPAEHARLLVGSIASLGEAFRKGNVDFGVPLLLRLSEQEQKALLLQVHTREEECEKGCIALTSVCAPRHTTCALM